MARRIVSASQADLPVSSVNPSDEIVRLRDEIAQVRQENERLQAALARQQRAHEELDMLRNAILNTVSHEMKTPLLHVKAAVSNLREEFGDNTLIDYATRATTRLEGIIRNITLLAGGLDAKVSAVSVRDSIDQALRALRRSWEHKDQVERVQTQYDDALPLVLIDPQAIGIALQLLIDNALKFSHEAVIVRAVRARGGVRIEIIDSGIGIAPELHARIFEPFYQVDSSTTRRFSGAGVGLAIVRVILDKHHVVIKVKSKTGKGSTFSFVLARA
jgi:signal transduction histidine kinase